MKKLLSIFLSFSLIFSLVIMKESLNENQVVYAASENQFEEDGAKVAYEFLPMLKALVGMTLSCGIKMIYSAFRWGSNVIARVFSVFIDLFTDYKSEKIRKLEEEKKKQKDNFNSILSEYEAELLKLIKILKDNEDNKNYIETLLNDLMKSTNKMEYLKGL